MFSDVARYLFSLRQSYLLPLHMVGDCISAFALLRILLVWSPHLLPVWLLTNQHFVKPVRVTHLYCIQEHHNTEYGCYIHGT